MPKLCIHENILKQFVKLYQDQKLAHAYLFAGPLGVGKFETAIALAKVLNCEDKKKSKVGDFCGTCAACRKIDSGAHPDIRIVIADGEKIKIEQIRQVLDFVRLRAFEAEKKILIIQSAEKLTTEAGNAFLKTLEEPSLSTLIILTSSVPENIMGTIRSRCHSVCFYSESHDKLTRNIISEYSETAQNAEFLAYFSEGCPGRAKELKEEGFIEKRDIMLQQFLFSKSVDKFLKDVVSDKNETKTLLDILLRWTRDAILFKAGVVDQRIVFQGYKKELETFSKKYTFLELNDLFGQVVYARRMLMENFNIKIALMIIKEQFNG